MEYLNKNVQVEWIDSYGTLPGWQEVAGYKATRQIITSWGRVIYEDKEMLSLAHNYGKETKNTPEQVNGIMAIPKRCIEHVYLITEAAEI